MFGAVSSSPRCRGAPRSERVNVQIDGGNVNLLSKKKNVLLVDTNSERRALRQKILKLQGMDVVVCSDLDEARALWQRERYHLVLIDIRTDHFGSLAFRLEIKKTSPAQLVAFLVGQPDYVALAPLVGSYTPDAPYVQWGEAVRKSMRDSCELLPQRNGFLEASWMIRASKRLRGSNEAAATPGTLGAVQASNVCTPAGPAMELLFA